MSDTKTSELSNDKSVTAKRKLRLPPNEGVLKIHIIHPAICIAFAGSVDDSVEIIHELCIAPLKELDDLLQYLQLRLFERSSPSEFIVGSYYFGELELHKVKHDGIQHGNSFWIGDFGAYQEFETHYNNEKNKKLNSQRFKKSFDDLIKLSEISTIGDFSISTCFLDDHKCFIYEQYAISDSGGKIINLKANTLTTLSEGTASEGAFTVTNLASDRILKPAVCLYFNKGSVAYLFMPISKKVKSVTPIVIKNVTLKDLQKMVLKTYGINLIGVSINNGKFRTVN